MSEMMERVARAIKDALADESGDDMAIITYRAAFSAADAAIVAMREPTRAMCEAPQGYEAYQPEEYCYAWLLMIDEALK